LNVAKIIARVKELYGFRFDKEVAALFNDMDQATLSSQKSRNVMDLELLFEKCSEVNGRRVNKNWLLDGVGPKFLDGLTEYSDTEAEHRRATAVLPKGAKRFSAEGLDAVRFTPHERLTAIADAIEQDIHEKVAALREAIGSIDQK
jgi:hypothetical protein